MVTIKISQRNGNDVLSVPENIGKAEEDLARHYSKLKGNFQKAKNMGQNS